MGGHITMIQYIHSKDMLVVGSQDCTFVVLSLEKIGSKDNNKDVLLGESNLSMVEIPHRYLLILKQI